MQKIVYSTCSVHEVENEEVVAQALASPEALAGKFTLLPSERCFAFMAKTWALGEVGVKVVSPSQREGLGRLGLILNRRRRRHTMFTERRPYEWFLCVLFCEKLVGCCSKPVNKKDKTVEQSGALRELPDSQVEETHTEGPERKKKRKARKTKSNGIK